MITDLYPLSSAQDQAAGREAGASGAVTAWGGGAPTGTAGIAWLDWSGTTKPTLMPVMHSGGPG